MFLTEPGTYENIVATAEMEDGMNHEKILFWKDLAGALALGVVIFAMLHLPLFA